MHFEETISTLKFGALCKTIKNKPKNNTTVDDKVLLIQAQAKILELEGQVMELTHRVDDQILQLHAATPGEDSVQMDSSALEQVVNFMIRARTHT